MFFGKFVGGGVTGLAEEALHHAHLGIEVVHFGDEDSFGRGGDDGGAPFEFSLVTENDVFETFEEVGCEFGFEAGFADELVTEDDVALQNAAAAAGGDKVALVFDGFADVVGEDAGEGEVGVDFWIEREKGTGGAGHVAGVFEQAVAVGVVHGDSGRRDAEGLADFVEHGLHSRAKVGVCNGGDVCLEFGPEGVAVFGSSFDEVGEVRRAGDLVGGESFGTKQARGEAVLVVFEFSFDADDAAFL